MDASWLHFLMTAEDGRLMADAETGEFWGFFGGFAPLPKRATTGDIKSSDNVTSKLYWYLFSSISTDSVGLFLTWLCRLIGYMLIG